MQTNSASVRPSDLGDAQQLPGRRTTPDNKAGSSRSLSPRPIVLRASPVARAAAAIPPSPAVRASTAANSRRLRSFRPRPTAANRGRIADGSIIAVSIRRRGAPESTKAKYPAPQSQPIQPLLGVAFTTTSRQIKRASNSPQQILLAKRRCQNRDPLVHFSSSGDFTMRHAG